MPKRQYHIENAAEWLSFITHSRGNKEIPVLQTAIRLHDPKLTPFLEKGLGIANILFSLGLDNETLAAGLVYPALKANEIHLDTITDVLGESVNKLLYDVMQMQALGKLQYLELRTNNQIENMRKMLLAMVSDVRAVLIVLAERVCQLHEAKKIDQAEQKKLAQETFDVYAPLANRLGIWQIKWEIEDLCLRYLEPEKYNEIAKGISFRRDVRESHIQNVIAILNQILTEAHIKHFEVTGRVKHIYSIYRKMLRKRTSLQEIYDMSALRVLVDSIEDCYMVLSLLQSRWQQIDKEFDDYISNPKANGYRSIHTVLIGPENHVIEVQIRTYKMHHESELGVAAHWRYKEGVLQTANYDTKIALLRQIMAWQKEVAQPQETKEDQQPTQDLFADRVYVFTPTGDIIDLSKHATPLDFAYHIHSEVGHRCRGAKVNGAIVPLTYHLQTGERVEVLTTKQANPSRDWMNPHLGYLNTQRARAKVAHWFRIKDSLANPVEEKPHNEKELKKSHEAEDINIPTIIERERSKAPLSSVQISGIDNLLTHLAKCCKPLPGDAIIGYVTRHRGVSVHRRNCNNAIHITDDTSHRIIDVNWASSSLKIFSADLIIRVNDRPGLLRDITALLSTEKIALLGLQTNKHHDSNDVDIYLTIQILDKAELKNALELLRKIPDVVQVERR